MESASDLHVAVIMPEHVHLLLTPLSDEKGWPYGLPLIRKQIKGVSARSVNKLLGCSGPVWQEESFDHVIRSNESFKEKREYIRQNPVRGGLSSTPEARLAMDQPMWSGHSCPLPLTLMLVLTFVSRGGPARPGPHDKPNTNPNSSGQECPLHTI
jgi:REP element-mobilizing transposase RayT